MSVLPPKIAEKFSKIEASVEEARLCAGGHRADLAVEHLLDAVAVIRSLIGSPKDTWKPLPLVRTAELVESAKLRRTPEEIAAFPQIADAIGRHNPAIGALGEEAAHAEQRYQVALVDWITRDWTCRCIVNCAEDPATAWCSLSGRAHVHPEIPSRPGVYGACPVHPNALGDL